MSSLVPTLNERSPEKFLAANQDSENHVRCIGAGQGIAILLGR